MANTMQVLGVNVHLISVGDFVKLNHLIEGVVTLQVAQFDRIYDFFVILKYDKMNEITRFHTDL